MKIASLVAYALVGSTAHKDFNKLLVEKEAMDINVWLMKINDTHDVHVQINSTEKGNE